MFRRESQGGIDGSVFSGNEKLFKDFGRKSCMETWKTDCRWKDNIEVDREEVGYVGVCSDVW